MLMCTQAQQTEYQTDEKTVRHNNANTSQTQAFQNKRGGKSLSLRNEQRNACLYHPWCVRCTTLSIGDTALHRPSPPSRRVCHGGERDIKHTLWERQRNMLLRVLQSRPPTF